MSGVWVRKIVGTRRGYTSAAAGGRPALALRHLEAAMLGLRRRGLGVVFFGVALFGIAFFMLCRLGVALGLALGVAFGRTCCGGHILVLAGALHRVSIGDVLVIPGMGAGNE